MEKKFHWRDLSKWLESSSEWLEGSREAMAVRMLLSGHRINLNDIPSVPERRSPGRVRRQLKKLLRGHDGITIKDGSAWIDDLV